MRLYQQIVTKSIRRSKLWKTIKNNSLLFMKNYKYRKIKSTNTLKNITMNHCKNILMSQKQYNFCDKIVNSQTWNKESRHISRNVLIVNEINMLLMLSTKKLNTWNHRNRLRTKCSWTSSSSCQNQRIQRTKKHIMRYLWWLIVWPSIAT